MVVTIIWMQPWAVIAVSLSAVLIVTTILLYCVCWKQKKDSSRFYVLDEDGLRSSTITEFARNSLTNLRLYRTYSNKEVTTEHIFTSKNLPFFKISNDMLLDSELIDSMDSLKSFENSTLQIVERESQNGTKEDLRSCVSSDSRYTFYSTHPTLAKSTSRGTFVSVQFNSDRETLID